MKRIADHCTIPLERGQRARWEAAARRKGAGDNQDMADWMIATLDAAADYERAVGRSAAELLRLMVPVPLRPLLRRPGREDGPAAEIVVPTVGVGPTATMPSLAAMPAMPAIPAVTVAKPAAPTLSAEAAPETPPVEAPPSGS